MKDKNTASITFDKILSAKKAQEKRIPLFFDLEITARCNLDCRHCYINLPTGDKSAKIREISVKEIHDIAQEAASMGSLWCLLTGGEPLLREDFADIYMALKKAGLLVSIFTNATLVSNEHIKLFKKYPPKDIEVTVYGVTKQTHEAVTRKPGTFPAFLKGLKNLYEAGLKIRLKAMALRSNFHELKKISEFCRSKTKDFYRFDPFLHLRYDGDPKRNQDIQSERLTPEEIVALEVMDRERFEALTKNCKKLISLDRAHYDCYHIFHCGAGINNFTIGYDGTFRLCSSLWHPKCIGNVRETGLLKALKDLVPRVRMMETSNEIYLNECRVCPIIDLCMFCPAHAYLESGNLDSKVDYFCKIAHARQEMLSTNQ